MRSITLKTRPGFSFIELLAVVLILAVLAGVAVPMYLNSRRTAAARVCYANLRAIQSAESVAFIRTGSWVSTTAGLVGIPEGLGREVKCPIDQVSYTLDSSSGNLVISCPNATSDHEVVYAPFPETGITLETPGTDATP